MIRVILADDHPVVREGISGMLNSAADIELVGEASGGHEAVALVDALVPDLVLMDLRMAEGDGVEATKIITHDHPQVRVVVLTTYDNDQDILRAIEAGASGYLLKDIDPSELVKSVRSAARGETVLAPSVASTLVGRVHRHTTTTPLSSREREVLRLAAEGLTNAAIGSKLFVSEATVKTYLSRAFDKLGVSDRTSAVRRAFETGLLGD